MCNKQNHIERLIATVFLSVVLAGCGSEVAPADSDTGTGDTGSGSVPGDSGGDPVNTRPTVTISLPANNFTAVEDDAVGFLGVAADTEDGNLSGDILWSSSIDGTLGEGNVISARLEVGEHVITASVTDRGGKSASATINVSVDASAGIPVDPVDPVDPVEPPPVSEPANLAPAVSVEAPSGRTVEEGEAIVLSGRAIDPEDGDISDGLSWSSSVDGDLSVSGSTFNGVLSVGNHTITASVTDSGNKTGQGSLIVTVMPEGSDWVLFYVDGENSAANDSNPGTEAEPWETIEHAADTLEAGEMAYIKAGVYPGDVDVRNSGERGREIIFSAYPGDERKAIIENGTFSIKGESHIKVIGLKIQNVSDSYGFRIEGDNDSNGDDIPGNPPVENITLAGNHTYDTYKSAISVWGVRYQKDAGDFINVVDLLIEDNLIEKANNGGYNENITLANGIANAIVRFNEVTTGGDPSRGGEGIDFKDGVRDSYMHDNYIHGLNRRAIYVDGGEAAGAITSNVHIYNNLIIDDPSSAIMIASEGVGNVDGVYIYNNVVLGSEQSGISVYNHPEGRGISDVQNIAIFNNTIIDGGRGGSGWGGIGLNHPEADNIIVRNNIAWDGNGYDIAVKNGTDATVVNNLCSDDLCEYQDDPRFVNPTFDVNTADYRLRSDSPAIDAGFEAPLAGFSLTSPDFDKDGVSRPQGAGLDLGAYEYIP
jgi:hypothetical protein